MEESNTFENIKNKQDNSKGRLCTKLDGLHSTMTFKYPHEVALISDQGSSTVL